MSAFAQQAVEDLKANDVNKLTTCFTEPIKGFQTSDQFFHHMKRAWAEILEMLEWTKRAFRMWHNRSWLLAEVLQVLVP